MTKVYFIDGKKLDLDSSEWELIYSDGRWSSRGVNLYFRKKDNKFILENWTNWQGENSTIELLDSKGVLEFLTNEPHPARANETIEQLGLKIEEF